MGQSGPRHAAWALSLTVFCKQRLKDETRCGTMNTQIYVNRVNIMSYTPLLDDQVKAIKFSCTHKQYKI